MEVKTMRTVFKVLAIAGVPATAYLAARGGRLKAERIMEKGNPDNRKEAAVQNIKAYGPAAAAGAATIASIVLCDYFGGKEIAAAGALAAGVAANKNRLKEQFEKYRGVVKEEDGEARDIDIMQKASKATYDGNGELEHEYLIHWLDKPVYFKSTHAKVIDGLNRINQELVDYSRGWGVVTMSDALKFLGKDDLCTPETDRAGWSYDLLNVECDCYWLDFFVFKAGESEWYKNKSIDPDVYIIDVPWTPWPDLQKELEEQHRIGTI